MNATDSPSPPPPPPGAAPGRPPLARASDDKIVSGLCGGLGRHLGIDPVVFRVAFVVLALAGGTGVLLYLIGWALVPDDRSGTAVVQRLGGESAPKLLAAVLAGVGLLLLFDGLTDDLGGDVPAGLILVAVGAAILYSRRNGGGGKAGEPVATTPSPAPPPPEPTAAPAPPAPPARPIAAEPPAAAARQRSPLVPVTLSLIAILAGALTLLNAADVVEVSLQAQLALALLLVGGGLVLGAWRGRALWLIPVGLALSACLVVAAVADVPIEGGIGERAHRPATVAQLSSPYRLAAGRLTVDLRRVQPAGTRAVVASVGAGELVVILPAGPEVTVDARVGGGELDVMGQHREGLDVSRRTRLAGQEGQGRLRLETRVGFGTLEVRRAPA